MRFRFNLKSFLLFLLLFMIEVLIALFVRDSIIRPYGGDVLVVIMVYYFIKAFVETRSMYICVFTLLFAYTIEFLQYLKMIETLGVQDNKVLATIMGSSFCWGDMVAYTIGVIICYLVDKK